ncbi:hypothetical protein WRSd5_p00032 (plasmid) [Shigella dysenteriae WRSd5]|nr:hypothetical protein WRSd5_p00032 [Shigella dysenteriae WRSd5]
MPVIFCSDMVSRLLLWLKFIHHGAIEGCRERGGRLSHRLLLNG